MEKERKISKKLTDLFNAGFFWTFIVLFALVAVIGYFLVSVFGETGEGTPAPFLSVFLQHTSILLCFAGLTGIFVLCAHRLRSGQLNSRFKLTFTATVITAVVLSDGTVIPCDFFVVTAGVRSNVEFLQESGLELSRTGLVYDETGRTNDPDIFGAGDVSGLSPIWPVAVKVGMIAAANMAGVPEKMSDFFASKSTMRFLDISTMSLGEVNPDPADETVRVETYRKGDVYKKIVHRDGKIIGALLQGDLAYGGVLQQLIARQIDVRRVRKPLFDIDYSDFFHMHSDSYEFYYE